MLTVYADCAKKLIVYVDCAKKLTVLVKMLIGQICSTLLATVIKTAHELSESATWHLESGVYGKTASQQRKRPLRE